MTDYADSTYALQLQTEHTDSVGVHLTFTVDPVLDAWFRYRGRVSRRRFLNIVRMRLKPLYKKCNLDPAWTKQFLDRFDDDAVRRYVVEVLQPGYRMSQPEPPFAPLGEESGPFDKNK